MKIYKPHETPIVKTVRCLIYGEPGIGKTTFGLSAPRPLLIDCEGGLHRVNPALRADCVTPAKWEEVLEVANAPELAHYDTVVFDTVGKMLDLITGYIIKTDSKMVSKNGGLTLQGYGSLQAIFKSFMSQMMNAGKSVVFIAHDREGQDDDKKYIRPDIIGRSLGTILREMDLVGYMQSRQGKRSISFTPSDTFYGKNTVGLDDVIFIPDFTETKKGTLSDTFDRFYQMQESKLAVMDDYNALMSIIDVKIEEITIENVEDTGKELEALQHIWDSLAIARHKFLEKLKELGLKFNKGTGQYEKV